MLTLSDETIIAASSDSRAMQIFLHFSSLLSQRYSEVICKNNEIIASSDWIGAIFKGQTYHPMLPFNHATFHAKKIDGVWRVFYKLSLAMQLSVFLALLIGIGALAIAVHGLIGVVVSTIFVFTFMTVSLIIWTRRARIWMAACLSPDMCPKNSP